LKRCKKVKSLSEKKHSLFPPLLSYSPRKIHSNKKELFHFLKRNLIDSYSILYSIIQAIRKSERYFYETLRDQVYVSKRYSAAKIYTSSLRNSEIYKWKKVSIAIYLISSVLQEIMQNTQRYSIELHHARVSLFSNQPKLAPFSTVEASYFQKILKLSAPQFSDIDSYSVMKLLLKS